MRLRILLGWNATFVRLPGVALLTRRVLIPEKFDVETHTVAK